MFGLSKALIIVGLSQSNKWFAIVKREDVDVRMNRMFGRLILYIIQLVFYRVILLSIVLPRNLNDDE